MNLYYKTRWSIVDNWEKKNSIDLVNRVNSNIKSSMDGLLRCVQCGMCTSTCPGAQHSDYNPRDMIERVIKGDESIIEEENIWNCFYCYTCHSICPVGNSASEVNQILKQMAIDKGIANEHLKPFLGFGDIFLTLGMGGIPSNFFGEMREDIGEEWWEFKQNLEEIRDDLDLDPLIPPKETIDEIHSLLVQTGFEKRIKKIREDK